MNWAEDRTAPESVIAGKAKEAPRLPNGQTSNPPKPERPYPAVEPEIIATRPVYPFPSIARYTGTGDTTSAANYRMVKDVTPAWPVHDYLALRLLRPGAQKPFQVSGGKIVPQ
jgi:feruloyl esterase